MNKRRILIFLAIFMIAIVSITIFIILQKRQTIVEQPEIELEEMISEVNEQEEMQDNINGGQEIKEETEDQLNNTTQSTQENNQVKESNKQATVTTTKGSDTKAKNDITQSNQTSSIQEKASSQEEVKQEQEAVSENNTTTKETEPKYIKNNSMISKMKQTIEANETEDMKTYGYEIVVDSSIKELTNQFTFSEVRVLSRIKYSFGTIRIYAEDYYNNGQFIMTQCYIL